MGQRETHLCGPYRCLPSRRLRVGGFTTGHATLKTATGTVIKHEKSCMENQHMFIPFAFDTIRFPVLDSVELQRIIHRNVISLDVLM